MKVRYIRLERESTDSWITFILPYTMTTAQADEWLDHSMPGWVPGIMSLFDPDEEFVDYFADERKLP